MTVRVLILGGYGTFGGRLAQLLADDPRFELVIAGRSQSRAEASLRTLPPGAARSALALDRSGDLAAVLADVRADVVVDATGPYQAYGERPYRVVEACLAAGSAYLDLADGAAFVEGIDSFDTAARDRGIFVLSGVSSFPLLTAAVVRRLSEGMDRIESVVAGIAPSPFAGIGLNVIRAIASYAGQPIEVWRDGRETTAHAFTETMRATVAPPGAVPVSDTLFALVDVPDNRVLAQHWPGLRSIWVGVGPTPEVLFRGLVGMAWLVRLGILPSLAPFARLLHWACNTIRWGENRGAMVVEIRGRVGGGTVDRSWHMVAEAGDGPLIPSMPAAAILKRIADGRPPPAGARNAIGDIDLVDYEALFAGRRIVAGIRAPVPSAASLYRQVLGAKWDALPRPIRDMHEGTTERQADGVADIDGGKGLAARLVRAAFGFPAPGRDVPVTVTFTSYGTDEVWRRTFAGRTMTSRQSQGTGRWGGLVVERFGPFAFGLAAVVADGRLFLVPRRWTMLGIPLPRRLAPRGETYEAAVAGRFRFHVEIGLPAVGLVVRYRGWLVPR